MQVGASVIVNISPTGQVLRPAVVVDVVSDSRVSVRILSNGPADATLMAGLGCPDGYPDRLGGIEHTSSPEEIDYKTWAPGKGA